jgi:hypothetical protein
MLTVPGGAATRGSDLVAYDVGYLDSGDKWCHLQFVCADDFNLPKERKDAVMTFPVRADRVPPKCRLAVKPLDCFQREGGMLICG